jgi:hypothetical protein
VPFAPLELGAATWIDLEVAVVPEGGSVVAGAAFVCRRCRAREPFPLPVRLPDWVALAETFIGVHRPCEPLV